MPKLIQSALATLLLLSPVPSATVAQEPAPVVVLDEAKKARALTFLQSPKAAKRKGAYAAFRKLGDAEKSTYAELLEKAAEHHLKQLGDQAFDLSVGQNTLTDFEDAHREWRSGVESTLAMVQTNWKEKEPENYKAKHSEMDKAFLDVAKLHRSALDASETAGKEELAQLRDCSDALLEIEAESAWASGEPTAIQSGLRDHIAAAGSADDLVEILDLQSSFHSAAAARIATAKHNSEQAWAPSPKYAEFAALLNDRRDALGLTPLRLEEKLSDSCKAHSADMIAKDFFSHTGSDGSSFSQRAKRANFVGGASGECIFKGISSASAAEKGWWYSDGHRLINYASGPNTLGLGIVAKHWTLNTARFSW